MLGTQILPYLNPRLLELASPRFQYTIYRCIPWGVTCREGSNDQVSEKAIRKVKYLIKGLMKVYL